MPTYQYQCEACGHELDEFQSMTESPLIRCPSCNTESLVRVLGTGAGLIFKGTGFYLTDYKKESRPEGKKEKAPKKEDTRQKPGTGSPTKGPHSTDQS
jgi:putative FmdB family regulatory protein